MPSNDNYAGFRLFSRAQSAGLTFLPSATRDVDERHTAHSAFHVRFKSKYARQLVEIRCSYKNTHFVETTSCAVSCSFACWSLCAVRVHCRCSALCTSYSCSTHVIAARDGFYDHKTCLDGQECNEILIGFVLWFIAFRLALMRRQKLLKFSLQTSIASSADDR